MAFPPPFGTLPLATQDLNSGHAIFQPGVLSMVVDPGYRTLDWFDAEAMTPDIMLSGSYDGGVSSIFRYLSQLVGFEHGTGSLEFDTIELGLKKGSINLGHKVSDMAPYQKKVPSLAGREIGSFLTRLGTRRNNISNVFVTGGGSSFYERALRDQLRGCSIQPMEVPVMTNARGYWLIGCDAMDG